VFKDVVISCAQGSGYMCSRMWWHRCSEWWHRCSGEWIVVLKGAGICAQGVDSCAQGSGYMCSRMW
jgi:hypothetical protein